MNIPAAGIQRRYVNHKDEYDAATQRVLCSGQVLNGEEKKTLEADWKKEYGLYTLAVNSGTGALELALRACQRPDVAPVVAMPSLVPSAVPSAALNAGYEIVFVDVQPNCQMDPMSLAHALALVPEISVVIAVHMFGSPCNIDGIDHIISSIKHHANIIEDCSHAHGLYYPSEGLEYSSLPVGVDGALSVFSCYPTKNLPSFGDAGLLCTSSGLYYNRARKMSQYGWDLRKSSEIQGGNYRIDELQAAYLNVGFQYLDKWNRRREKIAHHYYACLEQEYSRPVFQGEDSVHHQYVLEMESHHMRNAVYFKLQAKGVQCGIHYDPPAHLQPAFARPLKPEVYGAGAWRFTGHLKRECLRLPMTERLASRVISLPCYPELMDSEVEYIVEAFNEIVRSYVVHTGRGGISRQ